MAAMLVDLPLAPMPVPAANRRWVHVSDARTGTARPALAPQARPSVSRPGGHRVGVAAPQLRGRRPAPSAAISAAVSVATPGQLRLTRRGLAVVMGGFALVMVTALVVLVAAFLAVPNEPLVAAGLLLG